MSDPASPYAPTRRSLLRVGAAGLAASPVIAGAAAAAAQAIAGNPGRILVVLELSGGNDGLNTIVPYGDDAYYRHRPTIGLKKSRLRVIDDHFGFNGGMTGFERLYKDGKLAIVHGCGYENPSFSHFSSMAYWQTAAPNSGAAFGWVGRLADAMAPTAPPNYLVNISAIQSLAVRAEKHTPIVFSNPDSFTREAFYEEKAALAATPSPGSVDNPSRQYLLDLARSANQSSALIRQAWGGYRSPIDYGLNDLGLRRVAAMIGSGLPARLYYTSYANNAFDTHVTQNDQHQRLLTYASDAVFGFMQDLERIGRANDVTVMIFSEFGRRVPENTSLGTDHGAANAMFVVGSRVKGGHYGERPSLTALDAGDNLKFTTDFRRVYATMIGGWLQQPSAAAVLKGEFEPFSMFS
ncbi:MAG TPA: DUF1501 domain-containing protein [Caulobacteraceae bacterium]|nr:DUF1501 domain-containing protein [Caulobacteraceae bacterium]